MLIGVDLDNTIITYDALFRRLADEGGFLADDGRMSKKEVRDTMWTQDGGHQAWTDIQALAYGPRIAEADAFPDALKFFRRCREQGVEVCIVSHKTEFAASDPERSCNLREAAMGWLEGHGFFAEDSALESDRVYFASTRQEKVNLIRELGCDLFVDDLIEVFEEPGYPDSAVPVLFVPIGTAPDSFSGEVCARWERMIERLGCGPLSVDLKRRVEAALDTAVGAAEPVGCGRNSRVYRIETEDGVFALKHYHDQFRLDAEFAAFAFLQGQGVTSVPEPVAVDREGGFAVYSFLEGEPVPEPTSQDIRACVEFMATLKRLSTVPAATGFRPAAEGFFRLEDIEGNIRDRLDRLEGRERTSALENDLAAFLKEDFEPALEKLAGRAQAIYAGLGLTPGQGIPRSQRTLSPSDFGFHNAVRTPEGLAFLDFEYFGWDDPAKLVSDFMLHPGMNVPDELRRAFASGILEVMGDPSLGGRVLALQPLFALKWCMILLNEFLRRDFDRRRFAGAAVGRTELLETQLGKARNMLKRALDVAQSETD
ncbi:aminoglycoside phosphotransferase family protein [uncultured Pseudodesulfovibrio sp.]|uniref:aminoglycoside phosphotransferase family protein n=1 Tax=uncultured Pseudodesulfovibrio sp. TaxID=2035858 RepID=UPI0029C7EA28|nr:aminoglycoside phosphotransferase family protein [uncultured Pseudodesulfovibrio sp.]